MKKLIVLIFACLSVSITASLAQSRAVGSWEGGIKAGKTIRLVFHIAESGNKFSGTMDSPDQGVTDIPCQSVTIKGDSFLVDMGGVNIMYKGRFLSDSSLTGVWQQNGMNVPLDLVKTAHPAELYRPQTPKPPFDYVSEDVIYRNHDKSIQYGATLTMPKGNGPFPAVLLITGSGQQNRDEEIFGHRPFAVIADYLTRNGYAVLRVDDRGMGKTTGDFKSSTSADFAMDAETSFDYLKARKEINTKKIGLLGHSEGGMIAEMLASKRKDVDFIVMIGGPGVKIEELMADQAAQQLASKGIELPVVTEYRNLYHNMEEAFLTSKDSTEAKAKMIQAAKLWRATAAPDAVKTVGMDSDDDAVDYAKTLCSGFSATWFNYFLRFDPQPYLRSLSCKVLALNGEKDIQVIAAPNLEGIRQSLAKSKTKIYETKELKGMNHLLQECKLCTIQEYAAINETISPTALHIIGDWLDINVKP